MIGILFTALFSLKKANEGFISLSGSFENWIGVSLVSAIISIIYTQILVNFLDPETMNKSLDLTIENMRIQNPEMPKEALESVRSIQKKNVFSFDFFSYR